MHPWRLLLFILLVQPIVAQARFAAPPLSLPLGLRVSATEANSPPGSCGCFFLVGGGMDIALPLHGALSAVVDVAGQHAGSVPGTTRGLSTITLLAGPRYLVMSRTRQTLFTQALFGAVRGFDAEFRRGTNAIDTATALAFALGGGYEFTAVRHITFRVAQVDYIQTNLPNGSDNRQRNIRFGAGIVVHLPTAALGRR